MARNIPWLQWLLFGLYLTGGAVALMMATPAGLKLLGQPTAMVTFTPATIFSLPWSLVLFVTENDSVTRLAILGVGYTLNVGIATLLARTDWR